MCPARRKGMGRPEFGIGLPPGLPKARRGGPELADAPSMGGTNREAFASRAHGRAGTRHAAPLFVEDNPIRA